MTVQTTTWDRPQTEDSPAKGEEGEQDIAHLLGMSPKAESRGSADLTEQLDTEAQKGKVDSQQAVLPRASE